MTIEFLICTIDARIERVADLLLPPQEGVSYLISWQHSSAVPSDTLKSVTTPGIRTEEKSMAPLSFLKGREDVRVVELYETGLSKNRNNALQQAQGDLLVIADDDCRYSPESIALIRSSFAKFPDAAAIQFQGHAFDGHPLHAHYPTAGYEYKQRPRGTYVSSWELVLRRQAPLPRFDERFGIGSYLGCGEEEVFIETLSRRGAPIYYVPRKFVQTGAATTGTRFLTSPAVQRAKGGVLAVMHGPAGALLRTLRFAGTLRDISFGKRIACFIQMLKGILYVYTHHPLP